MIGEELSMLKKIMLYDLLIGIVAGISIQLIWGNYTVIFILGLYVAIINFAVSKLITSNMLHSKLNKSSGLAFFINFIKIFIICIIGVSILNNNINNVISYILGFTSHFLALILYARFNLSNERK